MLDYNLETDKELVSKRCPKCDFLIEADIIRDINKNFLKYRNYKCSNSKCNWKCVNKGV